MQKFLRGPGAYLILILIILLVASTLWQPNRSDKTEIDYSTFITKVESNQVERVALTAYQIVGLYKGSEISESNFPKEYDFKLMAPHDIDRFYRDQDAIAAKQTGKSIDEITTTDYSFALSNEPIPSAPWYEIWGPTILMLVAVGVFIYIIFRMQSGGGNKVMTFGKSRARLGNDEKKKVTFGMVAGADEEKEELAEIVEFLRDPRRFMEMGARIPKGVLLVGPPGTGKTYLARAVAGEAGVPFFTISGSDFVEMFVGVGASRVRDLFEQAKKNAPSIVFIDEIDAVGRHRGAGMGGGHDEREQTLNQLLVEMDGFAANEGVIIIAATNRPDILDPALLRPGRFDRQITVGLPDTKGREAVLRIHAKGKPLADEVDLSVLAKRTHYFSPADLENVMNEAALLAARHKKKLIGMEEVEEAITRVQIGPEKKSRQITEKDRKLVAYHESGHAIIAHVLEHTDDVHEVSIIPRGRAGGYTMTLSTDDEYYISRAKLSDRLVEFMGGNVAELIIFRDISTGATSDLRAASDIARRMVTEYGMSERLGPLYLGGDQEVFIGRDFGHARAYSEEVAAKVDGEIQRLLDEAYERAEKVLREHIDKLHLCANELLEKEKLTGEEFRALMEREPELPQPPVAAVQPLPSV